MSFLAAFAALLARIFFFWRSEQTPLKNEEHNESLLRKEAADMAKPSTDYNADLDELRK